MDTQSQLELLALIVALLLAVLAAAAETALSSVSRLRVRQLASQRPWARRVMQMHEDPNTFLSTVLVVNTAAITFASVSAATLADHLWHLNPFLVSVGMSFVLLELAELTPKTFAVTHSELVARLVSGPVLGLSRVFRPLVWLLGFITNSILLRPTLKDVRTPKGPFVSEEELRYLLNMSEEQGVLEEGEVEVIHRIFEIGDMLVREVMVPRPDIVAVEVGATRQGVLKPILDHGHTRIPVYEGSLDNVVGIIHAKDLLRYMSRERRSQFDARALARPAHFAPETKKVDEMLQEMQATKVHMFVVVDEHGGTAGIVTIEDILEQIVGEIRDEYDTGEEEEVELISETVALLQGGVGIDTLSDLIGLDLSSDHFDTVAGYVVSELGHIAVAGDTIEIGEASIRVEGVDGHRIRKLRVECQRPFTELVRPEQS